MKKILLLTVLVLLAATLAMAVEVSYKLSVPGVVWSNTAARARGAVEPIEGVSDVKTDISGHTLTVRFDDEKTSLEEITKALNKVGYTVGEPEMIEKKTAASGG